MKLKIEELVGPRALRAIETRAEELKNIHLGKNHLASPNIALSSASIASLFVHIEKRAHLQLELQRLPALAHLQFVHLPVLPQPQLTMPGPPVNEDPRANSRIVSDLSCLFLNFSTTPVSFTSAGSIGSGGMLRYDRLREILRISIPHKNHLVICFRQMIFLKIKGGSEIAQSQSYTTSS